jgi:hypothetical protein
VRKAVFLQKSWELPIKYLHFFINCDKISSTEREKKKEGCLFDEPSFFFSLFECKEEKYHGKQTGL